MYHQLHAFVLCSFNLFCGKPSHVAVVSCLLNLQHRHRRSESVATFTLLEVQDVFNVSAEISLCWMSRLCHRRVMNKRCVRSTNFGRLCSADSSLTLSTSVSRSPTACTLSSSSAGTLVSGLSRLVLVSSMTWGALFDSARIFSCPGGDHIGSGSSKFLPSFVHRSPDVMLAICARSSETCRSTRLTRARHFHFGVS